MTKHSFYIARRQFNISFCCFFKIALGLLLYFQAISWGHPSPGWGHSRGPHPPSETHIAPASSFLAPCLVRACPSMNWANKRRRPVCWHADDKRTLVVPMSNTKHDHDNVLKICLCFWICDDICHLMLHWLILYIEYTFCKFIVISL